MNQKSILFTLNEVTRDKRLKHYEVRIFNVLVSYNGYGKIFPSLETISKDTGIKSKSDISKALKHLHELEYIKKRRRKYNSNIYEIRGVAKVTKKTRPDANKPETSEPIKQEPHIEHLLKDEYFLSIWNNWKTYLKQKGIAVTEMTEQNQLRILSRLREPENVINEAISKNWKNFYPPKDTPGKVEIFENEYGKYLIDSEKKTTIRKLEENNSTNPEQPQDYKIPYFKEQSQLPKAKQEYKIDNKLEKIYDSMRV